jgi:hypothetical protein
VIALFILSFSRADWPYYAGDGGGLMQEQQQVNKARLIGYGIGIVAVAIVLVAKFVLKF